jgi:hypothetical protein
MFACRADSIDKCSTITYDHFDITRVSYGAYLQSEKTDIPPDDRTPVNTAYTARWSWRRQLVECRQSSRTAVYDEVFHHEELRSHVA